METRSRSRSNSLNANKVQYPIKTSVKSLDGGNSFDIEMIQNGNQTDENIDAKNIVLMINGISYTLFDVIGVQMID